MPIVYDDRDEIHSAAEQAKQNNAAKKVAKEEAKNYKKAVKESEKYNKNLEKIIKKDERAANRNQALLDIGDLVSNKYPGLATALDYGSDLLFGTDWHNMSDYSGSGSSGSGSSGSGSSGSGSSGSGYRGSVNSGSGLVGNLAQKGSGDPYQGLIDSINATVKANNEWSAQQAQKQMDFQLMMSNTAHQREVEDLKAAGLNPVLSAGGSGASTGSGAMAQADTSNSRLLAEVSLEAIAAMENTAVSTAGTRSKKKVEQSTKGSLLSKLGASAASGFARSIGYALGRGLFG